MQDLSKSPGQHSAMIAYSDVTVPRLTLYHAASSFLANSGVADLKKARISFFCPASTIFGLTSLNDFLGDGDGVAPDGTPMASSSRANSVWNTSVSGDK